MDDWFSPDFNIRLGASVQDLAREMFQSLLGYEGDGGHVAPRADIAKLRKLDDLRRSHDPDAREQWLHLIRKTPAESAILQDFDAATVGNDFNDTVEFYEREYPGLHEAFNRSEVPANGPGSWKDTLASAIKKQQALRGAQTYSEIHSLLYELQINSPESYKLWPWAVGQLKKGGSLNIDHIAEVVGEAGEALARMRAENRLPQNFDLNKMDFKDFEKWWMKWKRDNRQAESIGDVVYQFHDGWTMQRLTTPAQLQFEGDEMGHCVGGYSEPVRDNRSIIYSLRDPKGFPHATIEVEGATVHDLKKLQTQHELPPVQLNRHRIAPTDPEATERAGKPDDPHDWDKKFEVVQVMGKQNDSPKAEYQSKLAEFFSAMRDQGIDFVRSDGWHYPYDAADEYNEHEVGWGRYPEEEYEELFAYHHDHPEEFNSAGRDQYGIQKGAYPLSGTVPEEAVEQGAELVFQGVQEPEAMVQHIYTYVAIQAGNPKEKVVSAILEALDRAQRLLDDRWDTAREQRHERELGSSLDPDAEDYDARAEEWDQLVMAEARENGQDFDSAQKYLNFFYNLITNHGIVSIDQLPSIASPNRFPQPHEMKSGMPEQAPFPLPQKAQPYNIPGAFS